MTLLEKLILDAGLSGDLTGDHLRQTALDIEAATFMRALRLSVAGDAIPEQIVADYLTKIYCDRQRAFLLSAPLVPTEPEPGLTVAERVRREVLRWMQAAHKTTYTPIPLSPDETTAAIRAEVRALQLVPYPEVIRQQFAAALGVKTEAPANV